MANSGEALAATADQIRKRVTRSGSAAMAVGTLNTRMTQTIATPTNVAGNGRHPLPRQPRFTGGESRAIPIKTIETPAAATAVRLKLSHTRTNATRARIPRDTRYAFRDSWSAAATKIGTNSATEFPNAFLPSVAKVP